MYTSSDQTSLLQLSNQRSVTLFSNAAAICCNRKASCIFCAAGSSSSAFMIWKKINKWDSGQGVPLKHKTGYLTPEFWFAELFPDPVQIYLETTPRRFFKNLIPKNIYSSSRSCILKRPLLHILKKQS